MQSVQDSSYPMGAPIQVTASNNIFAELGNNTYNYRDLLSELIDNSISARLDGELLTVQITIGTSALNPTLNWLTIRDNGSGILEDRLGPAISPAAIQTPNSLNEHGLGMKQAVAGLGKLRHLITRTPDEPSARAISTFQFGEIRTRLIQTPWAHGTEIAIHPIKDIVQLRQNIYNRDIVDYLGARYRRYLTPANPKAKITIAMVDIDDPDDNADPREYVTWELKEQKPAYLHTRRRTNAPEVDHRTFRGQGWEASLVFGYSPTEDHEWEELGMPKPQSQFYPYAVTLSHQGLDVLLNDRVIMFHQLSELDFITARHNDFNHIRGEIILKRGFTTAITKNSIVATAHWTDCISQIKQFLDTNGLIRPKTNPGALPERALRDRLAEWLRTNPVAPKAEVKKEYAIEGLGGKIDVLADGEAWELKRDDASGLDVYQLFAYLDMGHISSGYLLAARLRDSAHRAKEHIEEKHGVQITLATLEQFPITQPLSAEERRLYN